MILRNSWEQRYELQMQTKFIIIHRQSNFECLRVPYHKFACFSIKFVNFVLSTNMDQIHFICVLNYLKREREIFWTSPHTHTLIDCSLYLYFSKLLREVALEYCNNSNQIQEGRKIFNYTHTHTHIDRQIHRHENKLLYWLLSTSSRNSLEHISSTDKCSIQ